MRTFRSIRSSASQRRLVQAAGLIGLGLLTGCSGGFQKRIPQRSTATPGAISAPLTKASSHASLPDESAAAVSPVAHVEPCGPGGVCAPDSHGGGVAPQPGWIANPQAIDPNEFLCNGGDAPPTARARVGDQIIGITPPDTVARYTTDRGEVEISPSNRVCVYSPRFASVRRVTGAESGELAVGTQRVIRADELDQARAKLPQLAVTGRDRTIRNEVTRGPDSMRARDRGVPVENSLQPETAVDALAMLENLKVLGYGDVFNTSQPILHHAYQSAVRWSVNTEVVVAIAEQTAATVIRDQTARELVVYDFPDAGRLQVCKVADKADALPGETVTFMIRIDNVGDSPLHDITLTDSLTTRLRYVSDSQTVTAVGADRAGDERDEGDQAGGNESRSPRVEFSTAENEGRSLRLTWKFADPLPVGQGITIEFRCIVR